MDKAVKTCEKCGRPLKDTDLFCGYCGHFVPKEQLNEDVKEDLKARSTVKNNKAADTVFSIRILGIALIAIGILSDLVGMLMISSSSYDSFGTVLFIGSASFIAGLVLTFGGRVF